MNYSSSIFLSIIVSGILIALAIVYRAGTGYIPVRPSVLLPDSSEGISLPVVWGSSGADLVRSGVIDRDRFLVLVAQRGNSEEARRFLDGEREGFLVVSPENAGLVLNLFWALGLGNQSSVLISGPMMDARYGGAGGFASTGGWTLASGSAMDHYARHQFIPLSAEEAALVERVARGVYRPCCNNPVYFPDCNHGMAMLGFLELMAAQGATEGEMYRFALALNALWFPNEYGMLNAYFEGNDTAFDFVDPKVVLGASYSSASGFGRVQDSLQSLPPADGGGCSV